MYLNETLKKYSITKELYFNLLPKKIFSYYIANMGVVEEKVEKVVELLINNKDFLDSALDKLENENEKEKERVNIEACKHYLIIQNNIKIELKKELSQGIKTLVKDKENHFLNESLKTLDENTRIIENTELFNKNDSIPIEHYHDDYKRISEIFVRNVSFADRTKLLNELRTKFNELKCNNYTTNTGQLGGMKTSVLATALVGIVSLISSASATQVSFHENANTFRRNPTQSYSEYLAHAAEDALTEYPVISTIFAGAATVYAGPGWMVGSGVVMAGQIASGIQKSIGFVGDHVGEAMKTVGVEALAEAREAWGEHFDIISTMLQNAKEYANGNLIGEIKPLEYIGEQYFQQKKATEEQKETYIAAKVLYKTTLELKGALDVITYTRKNLRNTLTQMSEENYNQNRKTIGSYLKSDEETLKKYLKDLQDKLNAAQKVNVLRDFINIMQKSDSYGNEGDTTFTSLTITQTEMDTLEYVVTAMRDNNISEETATTELIQKQLIDTLTVIYESTIENVYQPVTSKNSALTSGILLASGMFMMTATAIAIALKAKPKDPRSATNTQTPSLREKKKHAMERVVSNNKKAKPKDPRSATNTQTLSLKGKRELAMQQDVMARRGVMARGGGKKTKRKNRTTKNKRNRKNTKKRTLRKKHKKTRR